MIKGMKILGNFIRDLSLFHKQLLYYTYIPPITLYDFPLQYFKSVPLSYSLKELGKIQQRAILQITGTFYTSPTWGIEAIASLILSHLHLDKLSSHHQMKIVFLSSNYTIKSLLECHLTLNSILHYLLLDKITLKQRLKIKSSIVDANNHLNSILPSFNCLHKELSSGFCLVDTFQNNFF